MLQCGKSRRAPLEIRQFRFSMVAPGQGVPMMKRAAEALRRQDWAAIVIEFLLVVVGVLLAFQISQWASGRNDQRVREESVERLLHEAEQDVASLRDLVAHQKSPILANMTVTASNLRNPAPKPEIADDMRAGIGASSVLPKPIAPDSVYQELIASGRFGEIGDVKMRDAVSSYASMMKYLDQAIDYARQGTSRPWQSDAVHIAYDANAPRMRRVEVDFRKLAVDREAQDQFLGRLASQQFVVGNYEEALKAAEAMCREVARVAGKPCRP